jgi:hypothetical protein
MTLETLRSGSPEPVPSNGAYEVTINRADEFVSRPAI